MKALLIINNFSHDLFTGLWTSSILVIWLLHAKAGAHLQVAAELHDIMKLMFWLGICSLATVLGTGLVRFRYYRPETDGSEKVKKGLLILKHVLFTAVFSGGTFLAYCWSFC